MFKVYLGMKGGKKVETTRRGFESYEEADAVYKKMAAQDAHNFTTVFMDTVVLAYVGHT